MMLCLDHQTGDSYIHMWVSVNWKLLCIMDLVILVKMKSTIIYLHTCHKCQDDSRVLAANISSWPLLLYRQWTYWLQWDKVARLVKRGYFLSKKNSPAIISVVHVDSKMTYQGSATFCQNTWENSMHVPQSWYRTNSVNCKAQMTSVSGVPEEPILLLPALILINSFESHYISKVFVLQVMLPCSQALIYLKKERESEEGIAQNVSPYHEITNWPMKDCTENHQEITH